MDKNELYRDIAMRTGGDIYIGVVGPVRTGKSTFIKRFTEVMVLPGVQDENARLRLTDELPQSAAGRTVMTTQPRFIPNEAAALDIDGMKVRIRMADCVGYMVDGAVGHMENNTPRMVRTPWFDHDIPFEEAAEIGTNKVMTEHSTIGILVTTDGSITDIDRSAYIDAEERVIAELKKANRPFIVLVNSTEPNGSAAKSLACSIAERHGVSAMPVNAMKMGQEELEQVLCSVLLSFPVRAVRVSLPPWVSALGPEHYLSRRVLEPLIDAAAKAEHMGESGALIEALSGIEGYSAPSLSCLDLASGVISLSIAPLDGVFYSVISEECGYEIRDDAHLIASLKDLIAAKREYDRIHSALEQAEATGYGTVAPDMEDMELEEPEIVQRGGRFGVRLRARASGLHIIKVNIASEVSPLVGTEEQSEEFAAYLAAAFESDPTKIWDMDIFGKSLYEMAKEGMAAKLGRMPERVQYKLQSTIERMVNEGCSGLICILL